MTTAVRATAETFRLAESPRWDPVRRRLLWVDIPAGAVLEGQLVDGRVEPTGRTDFGEMVGTIAAGADGRLLVAAQEHLVAVRPDGSRVDGPRIVPAGERRRLNDGTPDPAGRFLVGTLSLAKPAEPTEPTEPTGREVLVRLEDDGTLTELDRDLRLSNGLAWTSDGTRMFSVDTLRHRVFVRDYDAATGAVGERRTHLDLDDETPDGLAMDAEDHLWVAVFGAGQVRRYAPDGTLVDRVEVPAPHTTCPAFAGDDLRTLVVSTGKEELTDAQRRDFPDSGALFTARVDVPGLPVTPWNGAGF